MLTLIVCDTRCLRGPRTSLHLLLALHCTNSGGSARRFHTSAPRTLPRSRTDLRPSQPAAGASACVVCFAPRRGCPSLRCYSFRVRGSGSLNEFTPPDLDRKASNFVPWRPIWTAGGPSGGGPFPSQERNSIEVTLLVRRFELGI